MIRRGVGFRRGAKRATIKDIAREAGVSASSVSLVLRDPDTKRVGVDTKKRINKIADRLNYRPNFQARSLVGQGSHTLGLVLSTLANPIYIEITRGIVRQANEMNYGVIITSVDDRGLKDERRVALDLIHRGVDGLIISSVLRKDPLVQELKEIGVPFVLIARSVDPRPSLPTVNCVLPDNQRGSVLAVEHLFRTGRDRFALILGPQQTSTGFLRRKGALTALEKLGITREEVQLYQGDYSRESGYRIGREIASRDDRPEAVFSANDIMAIGLLHAFTEAGIKVPEDISLVGFDDIEMAGLPGVDLTSIAYCRETMGELSVERLIKMISSESKEVVSRTLLDPVLTVRSTCGYDPRKGYQRPGLEPQGENV